MIPNRKNWAVSSTPMPRGLTVDKHWREAYDLKSMLDQLKAAAVQVDEPTAWSLRH
jgi:hypothetical protein